MHNLWISTGKGVFEKSRFYTPGVCDFLYGVQNQVLHTVSKSFVRVTPHNQNPAYVSVFERVFPTIHRPYYINNYLYIN